MIDKLNKSDNMGKFKKQDEELLERISALEARLQAIEQNTSPAQEVLNQDDEEEVTQQDEDEEVQARKKQDDEEEEVTARKRKQDDDEEEVTARKRKQDEDEDEVTARKRRARKQDEDEEITDQDEDEETTKQDGGDLGTTEINPDNEGGDVVLPESTVEAIEDDEGTEPETDAVTVMEKKLRNIEKSVKSLRNGLSFSKTPRQKFVTKRTVHKKQDTPSQQILKSMRKGKPVNMNQIRKWTADQQRKQYEATLNKVFG